MNNGTESYIDIEEKIHYPKRQNEADRAVEVGTASLDSGDGGKMSCLPPYERK